MQSQIEVEETQRELEETQQALKNYEQSKIVFVIIVVVDLCRHVRT